MRVIFLIGFLFISFNSSASKFEKFIAEVNEELKSSQSTDTIYPTSIYIISKQSEDEGIRSLAKNFPDDFAPTVIYTWISNDQNTIKRIQGDPLGVIKKMMSERFESEMYKNCLIKDSTETIITSNGYDLMYVHKSPEGWELMTSTIKQGKCNKLASGT
ncbi:hypothetical protein [Pseudoalteromonas sp. SR43-5]|uniref:hypothetical protein n=1 Tax=Pseudoalteromonas sp. SR43-5 TaxID=2760941 RepID=UPI0015F9D9E0|nr:hypothetical protein [Pseudoalteromonas sp. SR43-5]MBB1307811.1 hypothetical protein [Pseudoalteromonas sp. SR43-5]